MLFGRPSLAFLGAPLCALVLGCGTILGIEDRKLDIQELTAEGYDGCEPENGECGGCTSDWHRCICEDWKRKTEAELRRDCAELAPESIRAQVEEDAEKAYQDYLDALDEDDDATDDDATDDDATDDDATDDDATDDDATDDDATDDDATDDDTTDDDATDDDATDDDATDDDVVTDDDGMDDDLADDDAPDDDIGPTDDDEPVDELPLFNDSYCDFLGGPPTNHCQGCFCGECNVEVAICQGDRGCAEIMDCSLGADCDPGVATGPGSCYTAATCRAAIDGAGGLAGESYDHFQDAMQCRKDAACPCGDVEPVGCPPGSACNNCISCWDDCVCTGGSQASCTNFCGDPACNTSNACADCLDCVDYCLCAGGADIGFCMNQCYGENTDASCNPQDGCFCNTCYDACICSGSSEQVCSQDCAEPAIPPNFVECEGGLVCDAFLPPPPDPIAQACCAGPTQNLCGLDPAPLFGSNATQLCLPLNQPGPLDAGCPNFITSDPPYNNAILDGCCRQDGTCGFLDNITALGCIDPTLFGQSGGAPCP